MHRCFADVERELKAPMFDLVELSSPSNSNDDSAVARPSDVRRMLSPRPYLPCIGVKLFIAAWAISLIALSIRDATYASFWMAYLTHWGFLVTASYSIVSCFGAVYLAMHAPANPGALEGRAGWLVKTTWALLAIAVPSEIVITILYWAVDFDYSKDDVDYMNVMMHGGMVIPIVIDGFLLSRIRLRMKQFLLFEAFFFLFLLWSIVHAFSGIGNPYADDGTQSDDAIYVSLAWKNNTTGAVVIVLVVAVVANPVIFLLCRAISRIPPRRLCDEDEERNFLHESHPNNEMAVDTLL